MGEIERWRLEVSGRVQMVNYRSRIQQLAEERGIVGQVWNDERNERLVHIEAQGSPQTLEDFCKAMGTPFGRAKPTGVKKVEVLPPDSAFTDFDVKRGEVHLETLERMETAGEALGQLVVETKGIRCESQSGFKKLSEETKGGFKTLSEEMKGGFKTLSEETKGGFKTLSEEMKGGFKTLSEEMKGGFKTLSEEMKGGFKTLSEETKGGFKTLSEETRSGFAVLGDKIDKGFASTNESLKRIEIPLSTEMRTEMHQLVREVETLKTEMTEVKKQHLQAHTHLGPVPYTG